MPIDWNEVRKDFETGGRKFRDTAKKHRCSESAIRKRARKEGWEKKEAAGPVQEADGQTEDRKEVLLDDHRSLWEGVKKRLVKGLRSDDVKAGLEELKVAKIAGEVLSSVIKGERLAWGLEDPGTEAENGLESGTAQIAGEMARLTSPPGTEEALDGE